MSTRPDDATIRVLRKAAVEYAADGQLLKAIAACKRLLALEPADAEAKTLLGHLLAQHDRRTRALVPAAVAGMLRRRSALAYLVHPRTSQAMPRVDVPIAASPGEAPPLPPLPRAEPGAVAATEGPIIVEVDALSRIPVFSDLPRSAFLEVLDRVQLRSVRAGETIVSEGEDAQAMYAVARGAVRVERRLASGAVRSLAQMGEGEFFGEMALFCRGPRLATVTAVRDSVLLELDRALVEQLCAAHPQVGVALKEAHRQRLLYNVLRASPLFHHLADDARERLIDAFRIEVVQKGQVLLEQGREGLAFHLLLRGYCEVVRGLADGSERMAGQLGEGDVFGALWLLHGVRAAASIRMITPGVVLGLDRAAFDELLMSNPAAREAIAALVHHRLRRAEDLLTKEGLSLQRAAS